MRARRSECGPLAPGVTPNVVLKDVLAFALADRPSGEALFLGRLLGARMLPGWLRSVARARASRSGAGSHVGDEAPGALHGDRERCFSDRRRFLGVGDCGYAHEGLSFFRRHCRGAGNRRVEVALGEDTLFDGQRDALGVHVRFRRSGAGRAAGADQRRAGKRRGRDDGSARSSDSTACSWGGGFDVHARILTVLVDGRATRAGRHRRACLAPRLAPGLEVPDTDGQLARATYRRGPYRTLASREGSRAARETRP
jgi:hypothetical protein